MIVLACRYSSRVNGTATERSDDDTRFVYCGERPATTFNVGYELRCFLDRCFHGHPDSLDLLFLPQSAYIISPPSILMDRRSEFLTQSVLKHYLGRAQALRRIAIKGAFKPGYWPKKAYHSYLYLHSAREIAEGRVPNFAGESIRETLLNIRNVWAQEQFEKAFDDLYAVASSKVPASLKPYGDYSIVHQLYEAIMALPMPPAKAETLDSLEQAMAMATALNFQAAAAPKVGSKPRPCGCKKIHNDSSRA